MLADVIELKKAKFPNDGMFVIWVLQLTLLAVANVPRPVTLEAATVFAVANVPRPVTFEAATEFAVARVPRPVTLEAATVFAVANVPRPVMLAVLSGVPAAKMTFPAESLMLNPRVSIWDAVNCPRIDAAPNSAEPPPSIFQPAEPAT